MKQSPSWGVTKDFPRKLLRLGLWAVIFPPLFTRKVLILNATWHTPRYWTHHLSLDIIFWYTRYIFVKLIYRWLEFPPLSPFPVDRSLLRPWGFELVVIWSVLCARFNQFKEVYFTFHKCLPRAIILLVTVMPLAHWNCERTRRSVIA